MTVAPRCSALVVLFWMHIVGGYKIGPPVVENPEICHDMFPHGHEAQAYTSQPPFAISVSDSCTTNQPITGKGV